jgi:zinc protease
MRRALALALVALLGNAAGAAPWESSGIDWSRPPALGPTPSFRPPHATRLKLRNGVALLVIENHRLPLYAIEVVVAGAGSARDPSGQSGLAAYTADLLDEGAAGLGPLALSAAIEQLGADLHTSAQPDAAHLSVIGLCRTLDPTLTLLEAILTAPALDEKEAARVHADRLAAVRLRRDRPREIGQMIVGGAIHGIGSAYGHPGSGVSADFERLTIADARAFYAAAYRPERTTVVIAGDVDPEALRARLDRGLGAWQPGAAPDLAAPGAGVKAPDGRLLFVDRPGAEQSDLWIGAPGLTRKDPRYLPAQLAATILGGTFTSRLNRRLREELGYTYGAGARLITFQGAGTALIYTMVFTPATADSLKEILRISGELAAGPIGADELAKGKQTLLRALPETFETCAGAADAFASLVEDGLPDDYYDGYGAGIDKLTVDDVRAGAAFFLPGALRIVVIGDQTAVGPAVDALGLGKPVPYTPDGLPQ